MKTEGFEDHERFQQACEKYSHGGGDGVFTPTPEQIAEATARIRATWTPGVEKARRCWEGPVPVDIQEYSRLSYAPFNQNQQINYSD